MTLNEPHVFNRLCHLLIEEGQSWLADELKACVLFEKGKIPLEDYIVKEAASDVHREFGGSRRVSEGDKKGIQTIIANRYQSTKEAWSMSIKSFRKQLDDLRSEKRENSTKIKELTEKIDVFLRVI